MKLIKYSLIPDNLFMKAIQIRDIRKARVLTREEKRKSHMGKLDIVIKSPLGFVEMTSREELTSRYKYINGKDIKLRGWGKNFKCMVMREDNTPVYAIYIPIKHKIEYSHGNKHFITNKTGKRTGDYIVCTSNNDGSINRDEAFIISNGMFRRMFKIITGDDTSNNNLASNKEYIGQNIKSVDVKNKVNTPKQIEIPKKVQDIQGIEKLKATVRLMRGNKCVGFQLLDNKGMGMQVSKAQLMQLCKQGSVTNIGVREINKKEYIHGIGMRIEEITEMQV